MARNTMKPTQICYGHRKFFEMALNDDAGLPDGRWVPARPTGTRRSIIGRLYAAWLVFVGRADALVWLGQ